MENAPLQVKNLFCRAGQSFVNFLWIMCWTSWRIAKNTSSLAFHRQVRLFCMERLDAAKHLPPKLLPIIWAGPNLRQMRAPLPAPTFMKVHAKFPSYSNRLLERLPLFLSLTKWMLFYRTEARGAVSTSIELKKWPNFCGAFPRRSAQEFF